MSRKKLSKRAKHDAWVRQQRKLGLLPYQDGTWTKPPKFELTPFRAIIADYKKQNAKAQKQRKLKWKKEAERQQRKIKLSPNGSILGNKYSYWSYPLSKLTKKDY
ncbi:MAG: hypothetical protein R2747_21050 [Pyrinomonadaceae bacterium]